MYVPVLKMNPPQKLVGVLVDLGQGEYVFPVEQLVGPPTPEGDVGYPNLKDDARNMFK